MPSNAVDVMPKSPQDVHISDTLGRLTPRNFYNARARFELLPSKALVLTDSSTREHDDDREGVRFQWERSHDLPEEFRGQIHNTLSLGLELNLLHERPPKFIATGAEQVGDYGAERSTHVIPVRRRASPAP